MAMATWGLGIMAAPIIGPRWADGLPTTGAGAGTSTYISRGRDRGRYVTAFVHDPAFMRNRARRGRVCRSQVSTGQENRNQSAAGVAACAESGYRERTPSPSRPRSRPTGILM